VVELPGSLTPMGVTIYSADGALCGFRLTVHAVHHSVSRPRVHAPRRRAHLTQVRSRAGGRACCERLHQHPVTDGRLLRSLRSTRSGGAVDSLLRSSAWLGAGDNALTWSPDGKEVADPEGAAGTRLTRRLRHAHRCAAHHRLVRSGYPLPTWSPDGKWIAFQGAQPASPRRSPGKRATAWTRLVTSVSRLALPGHHCVEPARRVVVS
jgi:hypothetical protein